MSKPARRARRIALFVEGDTERGEARRRTLSDFFHRWLDPQLRPISKVGITTVKFQGVSNYLDDLPQKVALYLDDGRANFVFGLIDLYGIPADSDRSFAVRHDSRKGQGGQGLYPRPRATAIWGPISSALRRPRDRGLAAGIPGPVAGRGPFSDYQDDLQSRSISTSPPPSSSSGFLADVTRRRRPR